MLTRTKLRRILNRYRDEFEKDYFIKFKVPMHRNNMGHHNVGKNKNFDVDNFGHIGCGEYVGSKSSVGNAKWNNDSSFGDVVNRNPQIHQTHKKNQNNDADENTKHTVAKVVSVVQTQFSNFNAKVFNCAKTDAQPECTNKDYKNLEIFHRAVWPIVMLGQCFAIMPVAGIQQPNPRNIHFSYKSSQMFIAIVLFSAYVVITLTMIKHLSIIGINAKNIVGLVFFSCVLSSCVLFFTLGKRWSRIMRYWTRIELMFTRSPYEEPKRSLTKRVRQAAAIIILSSLVEHLLYMTSAVLSYTRKANLCAKAQNISSHASFEEFVYSNYDYVFKILPVNTFVGVWILVTNFGCTFVWNYMDLFIMMISKGIAYRFEQITMRINKIVNENVTEGTFIEIREHYVKVCELLEYIDENLSGIILLSCVNNLYFVCYQLLNIFNKLRWPINYIYFWYSLLYLIGRTAFVFLTAASINDESKAAVGVLRSVSNKAWCIEIERLIFQMSTQTVALSGKKFYFLTRRLLFGMAGTIVTYELVLLQFDEPNRSKGLPPLCG